MKSFGLERFIEVLENNNELCRIKVDVDVDLEIAEIVDRISKLNDGGSALLFENTGTKFPLLINMYGSDKRACLAFGINDLIELEDRIDVLFNQLLSENTGLINKIKLLPKLAQLSSFLPKKKKGVGVCQQNIIDKPNLNDLPIIKSWPHDGGRFLTLPLVHTLSPINGILNVGMYRMQVYDNNTTGMHWHMHKGGAQHFNEYKSAGEKMPVSVVLGGDPIYTYVATAPIPENIDEYILAGFIRKKAINLVKCITNNIYVPEDADIVIEGYIDPKEKFVTEGPFGDHTGFYSLEDKYPQFHVTCITHKNNAVYPATLVGIPPMEDSVIGKITERIFHAPIKYTLIPELKKLHLPIFGVVHNLVLVSAKNSFPGSAFKIANAIWGAGQLMFSKIIFIFDENVDIYNYSLLWELFLKNFKGEENILVSKGPMDVLDHSSSEFAFGGKLCVDLSNSNNCKIKYNNRYIDMLENLKKSFEVKMFFRGLYFVFSNNHSPISLLSSELKQNELAGCVILVDENCKGLNISTLLWYVLGNIDPKRDILVSGACIIVDGKRKSDMSNFKRRWPEVVKMQDSIINKVDLRWKEYELGSIIDSPSRVVGDLIMGDSAEVDK